MIHAPPRGGKTETILAAIARSLERNPHKRHAYITHEKGLAEDKSRVARDLAVRAGVAMRRGAGSLGRWQTRYGGGLRATSWYGGLTGRGVDGLLVVDDPFKSRTEAESSKTRRRVSEWFRDVAYTRREPGVSILVVMTRWHPNDLAGELIAKGWQFIRLPAISDAGESFWPERWPLPELEKIRAEVGEFTFTSLYQGLPRPRGGAVFEDVFTYDELPRFGFKTGVGFDLAYSKKTSADYSVGLVMHQVPGATPKALPTHYVAKVLRKQVKAQEFKRHARELVKPHPHAKRRWYAYGPEIAVADLFKAKDEDGPGVDVGAVAGDGDKFVRAQPFAAAWNAGRVLVPSPKLCASNPAEYAWVEPFVTELCAFTGLDDDQDDQVDAGAACYDVLNAPHASLDDVSGKYGVPVRRY